MKNYLFRIAGFVVIASFLCLPALLTAGEAAAEGAAPKKAEDVDAAKAEAKKQREAEEAARHLENIKKQVAEGEKRLQEITDKLASGKAGYQQGALEKQSEFLKKDLGLLQSIQKAVEAQDYEQARTLREQEKEHSAAWWSYGQAAAQLEADKARWTAELGSDPSPEATAAVGELNKSYAEYLQKLSQKQALEKELQALRKSQAELTGKAEKAVQAARRQKKEEAMAKAKEEQAKAFEEKKKAEQEKKQAEEKKP